MSNPSARDERTCRWGLDEYIWGDPAGCDASGTAPGRAQCGSQASTGRHQVVRGSRRESAAHSASLRLQSGPGEPMGEGGKLGRATPPRRRGRYSAFRRAMVKHELERLISEAVRKAQAAGDLPAVAVPDVPLERPHRPEHGDYASSLALRLARSARMGPLEGAGGIAQTPA